LTDNIKDILKDADYTAMPPQLDAMKNSILDYVRIVTDDRLLFIDFSKSSEKLTMALGTSDYVKPLIDKLKEMSLGFVPINTQLKFMRSAISSYLNLLYIDRLWEINYEGIIKNL
jgi:hypothetical protein